MQSPKGRPVIELEGEPGVIRSRGSQITRLGNQMENSATFLQTLADDASGMKGEAVEKLQEVVGETYKELGKAAELYKPVGPILVAYANDLSDFQTRIKTAVENCESAKESFDSADGYLEGQRPFWAKPGPLASDEDKEKADEENDAADGAKQRKYDEYQDELKKFDSEVDSWEGVFDSAADQIEASFDGKIKDGFWDNVDGAVAVVVKVLQVVGTIVAIAAIIIGGPIIAAIGAVVAVATLALVAYQFIRGDASGVDLALAIVGVIPFGSAGKLFQGKQGVFSFIGDAFPAFKPSTWSAAAGQLDNIAMASRFAGGGARGFLQGGRSLWQLNNPAGVGDVMSRFMFGKDTAGLTGLIDNMSGGSRGWMHSPVVPAAVEFTHTMLGAPIKITDKIANWTGNSEQSISKRLPWLGAML
jgi:hypothetical protein